MRESIPRQVDKKSRVPEEEIGIWDSRSRDRGLEFSRRRKGQTSFFSTFLSLSHIKRFFFFFSLSLDLMITQQTTHFKLGTRDYITTMYPAWGQFLLPESEVTQWCLTLCNTMGCSLPGSSIHGIFQARVLEWIAISFSRGSYWPRDWTQVSCIAGTCFTFWTHGSLVKTFWLILLS